MFGIVIGRVWSSLTAAGHHIQGMTIYFKHTGPHQLYEWQNANLVGVQLTERVADYDDERAWAEDVYTRTSLLFCLQFFSKSKQADVSCRTEKEAWRDDLHICHG